MRVMLVADSLTTDKLVDPTCHILRIKKDFFEKMKETDNFRRIDLVHVILTVDGENCRVGYTSRS